MAIIEQVRQLKLAGKTDGEIISDLQERGLTPREINDVLARVKVKDAVFNGHSQETEFSQEFGEGMQPSMLNASQPVTQEYPQQEQPYSNYENQGYQGNYRKQTQEILPEPGQMMPETYSDNQSYQNQGYQGQEYQQYNAVNTETMTEIASQLIDEKIVKITSALKDLTEMKSILDVQVKRIDERLTRIESIIDTLQTSLIRKTSEQEQNISDIKTELHGMQTGFSKIINPIVDKTRGMYYKSRKTSKKGAKKKGVKK
ncbi:hypothetical protein COU56_01630 [Candidatus Pacearchaeota archaeon CG10_big_fil_rev_8_21_14_0_10_31_9]|nr:MAG: hypothetical protein COU56_01630 [Candidatus Pacearchaeota archaeon CG10_big_fil_rev_8_21_14_0_10_31_9]